ncbi:MAG: hypothetical protein AAF662_15050 [Pseudomonadota bacterium]
MNTLNAIEESAIKEAGVPVVKHLLTCLFLWVAFVTMLSADEEQLARARFELDLQLAEPLLLRLDPEHDSKLFADASLLAAELKRGEYERETEDKQRRRALGKEIDRIARAGLKALDSVPESSERYRIEADLNSTMIRTKFRGMKLQPKVEASIDKALELDPFNASAIVSAARRPLFAKPKHGGDLTKALSLLDSALDIEPEHLSALMLRSTAYAKLGDAERAERDWAVALSLNPNIKGARESLLGIELPGSDKTTRGEQ